MHGSPCGAQGLLDLLQLQHLTRQTMYPTQKNQNSIAHHYLSHQPERQCDLLCIGQELRVLLTLIVLVQVDTRLWLYRNPLLEYQSCDRGTNEAPASHGGRRSLKLLRNEQEQSFLQAGLPGSMQRDSFANPSPSQDHQEFVVPRATNLVRELCRTRPPRDPQQQQFLQH